MDDDFALFYAPTHRRIEDVDVGTTAPLMDLLERTYLRNDDEHLIYTRPMWRPSLIARSDAEIYDVEDPRWAKRVHVFLETEKKKDYLGFINMRPRRLFEERLSGSQRENLAKGLRSESLLVCGSYLAPPRALIEDGFRFPTSFDMGVYHNELGGWQGTVFASPALILGGLCSQACVYMASYPMARHGCHILGISDIALAAEARAKYASTSDVEIQGLTLPKLRKVFESEHLGLNAFWERVPFRTKEESLDPRRLNEAASVVTSYLCQGLPVILSVHMARLVFANPEPYSPRIRTIIDKRWKKSKQRDKDNLHAVMIVGFRPPSRSREYYEFVYHDSAAGPYIPISVHDLSKGAADKFQRDREPYAFDLVVPRPNHVGTPLKDDFGRYIGPAPDYKFDMEKWKSEQKKKLRKRKGLRESSKYWRDQVFYRETGVSIPLPLSSEGFFPLKISVEDSCFFLVDTRDFFDRYVSLATCDRVKALRDWQQIEPKLPATLWVEEFGPLPQAHHNRLADRAIWGYWAWSADERYPKDLEYQIPVFQCTQGKLSIDYRNCQIEIPVQRDLPIDVRRSEPLHVGAITSYSVGPMRNALEGLASHRIPNVDLFLFQADDLQNYYGAPPDASPLEIVSSARVTSEQIAERIAKDVLTVREHTHFPFTVRGFATYLPEISSLDTEKRKNAVAALKHIIRIAGILKNSKAYGESGGFDTRFVEIVAGTRVSRPRFEVKQVRDRDSVRKETVFLTTVAGFYDKLQVLLESLGEIAQAAYESDVYVSIEVEPGLLPLVSEFTYVDSLVKALEEDPEFRDTVKQKWQIDLPKVRHSERIGINVDVCHMRLCRISPEQLRHPAIVNRITHIHIGDIGPGHLCDLVTGTVSTYDKYHDWIQLFLDVANGLPRANSFPDFSSCLSIELEACRDLKMVAAAYHRTKLLLREHRSRGVATDGGQLRADW